ncbi:helix-turn-helix domain-containing protein [Bacillus mobilis]|uniref:Helix-turn-helix domain-containing protein n=1 Tax=Bacillus mobilis TaxID=2026190 RepID=A0ABV4S4T1_9BACI
MNAKEVAKLLGTHPENIRRWIREGKIKAVKNGRSFDIPQSEVNILMQSKSYEDLGKAQENAAYQLIINLESEIESELSQIQLYSGFLQREMKRRGISETDHSTQNYEKRRKVYEEEELSSLRKLVDIGKNIGRLEKLKEDLQEIAKVAEKHNTIEKSHDYLNSLFNLDVTFKKIDDDSGDEDDTDES